MRKIYILLFILLVSSAAYGQYENTLYYLDRIPQANYLNPALNPKCNWWMGGVIIPIAGQVLPPIAVQVNTPFSISDLIYPGKDYYLDSLVTPWHPSEDPNTFYDKLNDWNYFTQEFQLTVLNFGFKANKSYVTFDYSIKQSAEVILPTNYIKLITQGNGNIRNAVLDGLGANALVYHQFALGYNREITDKLKLGLKVKYLNGLANIATEKSELSLITATNTNEITIHSDYIINTNLPIDSVSYDDDGIIADIYNRDLNFTTRDEILDFAILNGNNGYAFDFGAQYQINSDFEVSASVIDLGQIFWNSQSSSFRVQGDGEFVGLDISGEPLDSLIQNDMGKFADSAITKMFDNYDVSWKKTGYTTNLVPRAFIGGSYKLSEKTEFGLLARYDFYKNFTRQSYTASLNFHTFRFGELGLSYSYINGSFANVGLGWTFRIGAWQMFFVSDNLFVITTLKSDELGISSIPVPVYARDLGIRLGTNLVFGRGKRKKVKENEPLLFTL